LALFAGVALLMYAGQPGSPVVRVICAVVGVGVVVPALRGLLPTGTLRFGRGLPSAIATRAVMTMAFFGAEAFLPLALTDVRGLSAGAAGLALTCGALGWSAGAWAQERSDAGVDRATQVRAGLLVLALGIAGIAIGLEPSLPTMTGVLAWAVAGAGMGLAFSSVALLVIAAAPEGEEGKTLAGLQTADVIGGLVGTGIGGAIVAASDAATVSAGRIASIDVLLVVITVMGAVAARRLPRVRRGARDVEAVAGV
jgi:hypothetical protein